MSVKKIKTVKEKCHSLHPSFNGFGWTSSFARSSQEMQLMLLVSDETTSSGGDMSLKEIHLCIFQGC